MLIMSLRPRTKLGKIDLPITRSSFVDNHCDCVCLGDNCGSCWVFGVSKVLEKEVKYEGLFLAGGVEIRGKSIVITVI